MRVLLADDHPLVRDGMRPFVLRIAEDVDLVEAGSLDEALEKGKGKHLDLALLDLGMSIWACRE
jgi:DNA-binding NarL/FixJ family response regulator